VIDIFADIVRRQRAQLTLATHPLFELPQFGALQHVHQFRLPGDDDLQQLLPGRFHIQQQPDLFEQVHREPLRLVDNQYRRPPFHAIAEQRLLQGSQLPALERRSAARGELRGQKIEKFFPAQNRIGADRGNKTSLFQ
jgi:hypothetical protein